MLEITKKLRMIEAYAEERIGYDTKLLDMFDELENEIRDRLENKEFDLKDVKDYLTVSQATYFAGYEFDTTIYNHIREGKIEAEKVNGKWRIPKDKFVVALEKYQKDGRWKDLPNEIYDYDRDWHTTNEIAIKLKVTPETISRWLREGKMKGDRFGVRWRVEKKDLKEFMEREGF